VLCEDADRPDPGLTAYAVQQELTSPQFARAWAKGCGCEVSDDDELRPGNVALFGSPQRWDLLRQAQAQGRTWFYGDHAYFRRREYYRATRDAVQLTDLSGEGDALRFERLDVRMRQAWRKQGAYVLLCPNSPGYFELYGLNAQQWIRETTEQLRRYTDRDIRVRFKNSPAEFDFEVRWAWAVVVYTSVAGVLAALQGVPCFATAPCASMAFGSGDLSLIERPVRPDNRFEMASVLAANQWTLHEIARGQAWRQLNG
jgi:hypothetical protein